jgi:NitT/TauT family transport system substrate-binding protein
MKFFLLLTCLAVLAVPRLAAAEVNEVRIAQPYGVIYLPSYVAVDRQLIQKHAKALGLPEPKVTLTRLSSGPAGSDMILSGNADFAMGGYGPMLTLWDKTRGPQKVKGVMALSSSPIFLISTDPRIKTIRDFGENDRIAVSAVKVTLQAIFLQMAAAKEFGWENRFKLDPLTVSMSNPDGMAAVLSGGGEVRTHATILPFSVEEMESGKAHMVMTSDEIWGGKASTAVLFGTERFRSENPKLYAALVAAFEEAIDFINANPAAAAEIYVKNEPTRKGVAWVENIIRDKSLIEFKATPERTMLFADFVAKLGTLKTSPKLWSDVFFDNVAGKPGS